MTGWSAAAPALLLVAGVLLLPGWAAAAASGVPGLGILGAAPALTVSMVAVGAVLLPWAGMPFGWPAAAACVLAGVALSALLRVLPAAPPSRAAVSPAAAALAVAAGVAAGAVAIATALARGIGSPDALSQTYDAVFHLNAVRWVLDHADGSSLHLAAAARDAGDHGFYPGAWHDVTALVATLQPDELPQAANAVAVGSAAVIWPLGCAALAHAVLGSRAAAGVAGVLSAGFTASPYLLVSFGVLWPNALATCLLPGILALLVHGVRPGQWRARGLFVLTLPGLALAHPNALFSLVVLAAPLLLLGGVTRARRSPLLTAPRAVAALGAASVAGGAVVVLIGLAVAMSQRLDLLRMVQSADWPARQTVAQAVGEVLLNAQARGPAAWLLSALVLCGAAGCWRDPARRWLPLSYAAAGLLYVLAAGSDSTLAQAATGVWYNDAFRLAALMPVVGVVLATAAVLALARWVPTRAAQHGLMPPRHLRHPLVVLGVTVVSVVVGSGGLGWQDHVRRVQPPYHSSSLLGPQERDLLSRVATTVPAEAVIAGNPWNGSALTYALGERRSLFPHLSGAWDDDRRTIAGRLHRLADDPAVCPALQRLGVAWAIGGPSTFWVNDPRQRSFAGLVHLDSQPGLRKVDAGGRLSLYQVTGCDRAPEGPARATPS